MLLLLASAGCLTSCLTIGDRADGVPFEQAAVPLRPLSAPISPLRLPPRRSDVPVVVLMIVLRPTELPPSNYGGFEGGIPPEILDAAFWPTATIA